LVWSNGVAVKKAAPVASPTASPTKTPSFRSPKSGLTTKLTR
jgi:hypothetical protein